MMSRFAKHQVISSESLVVRSSRLCYELVAKGYGLMAAADRREAAI